MKSIVSRQCWTSSSRDRQRSFALMTPFLRKFNFVVMQGQLCHRLRTEPEPVLAIEARQMLGDSVAANSKSNGLSNHFLVNRAKN